MENNLLENFCFLIKMVITRKIVSDNAWKRESLFILNENVNLQSHYKHQYGHILKNYYMTRPYLLNAFPNDSKITYCRDTCTSLFVKILAKIVKKLNQPAYLSADGYIKKMFCIQGKEVGTVVKNRNMRTFVV